MLNTLNKIDKIINDLNDLKIELTELKNELYLIKNEHKTNNSENKILNNNFIHLESNQNNIKLISNIDLNNNKYDEKTLEYNMERGTIYPYTVLKTQKNLSNEFIVEYILNEKYAVFREDFDITINKVIGLFPNFANYEPKPNVVNKL